MNEIEIKKYELPRLEIKDYDQIKKFVEEENEKYKNYLVTEDTLEKDTKKEQSFENKQKQLMIEEKKLKKKFLYR